MKRLGMQLAAMMVALSGGSMALAAPEEPATLHVGDNAPALSPAKWLKGAAVTKFEPGKTYIVEFWATWCGPCKASIPHLSKLQEEYKDITFIGQDVWEQDQSGVPAFVTEMGDKMNYRVALDDMKTVPEGTMATAWMTAAGQHGIPTAFLVDKEGKIAWIGHPMELDDILKSVAKGTFDPKAVAAEREAKEAVQKKLTEALQANDFDKALGIIDDAMKTSPSLAQPLTGLKFRLLLKKKDYPAAWGMGPAIQETFKEQPQALCSFASMIVDPQLRFEKPDLDLAEKLATAAVNQTKEEDFIALLVMAKVEFAKGNIVAADQFQNKSIDKAPAEARDQIKAELAKFRSASTTRPATLPQ